MDEEELRRLVWNENKIVEMIQKFPQTYQTILGCKVENKTITTVLRRRLNNLCSDGIICKTSIIGTVFGKCVFYALPKKYHLVLEANRMFGSQVFVFFKYEQDGFYTKVNECWVLKDCNWEKMTQMKVLFEGDILRWI